MYVMWQQYTYTLGQSSSCAIFSDCIQFFSHAYSFKRIILLFSISAILWILNRSLRFHNVPTNSTQQWKEKSSPNKNTERKPFGITCRICFAKTKMYYLGDACFALVFNVCWFATWIRILCLNTEKNKTQEQSAAQWSFKLSLRGYLEMLMYLSVL